MDTTNITLNSFLFYKKKKNYKLNFKFHLINYKIKKTKIK